MLYYKLEWNYWINKEGWRMIYVTGDTHAQFDRFSNRRLRMKGLELTDQDYVIVCGDFGLCWSQDRTFAYNCDNFSKKKYTILWVQGNHENYDMIEEFPIEEWHGGKVRHIVRDKVILLERGQVFEIEGKTFFTFGGARSHDLQGGVLDRNDPDFARKRWEADKEWLPYRILHESWWPQELPSEAEMAEGLANLEKVNYKVDYVITHCCASRVQDLLDEGPGKLFNTDVLTDYFDVLEEKLVYEHWYFGHYHMDLNIDEKHSLLYHGMVPLDDKSNLEEIPVPGNPRYMRGDIVRMKWDDAEKIGKISVVDAYGTFGQNEEPSYDIFVEEDNCIYKHIMESEILGKIASEEASE